jgi:predicted PurR-regulated permease PerM
MASQDKAFLLLLAAITLALLWILHPFFGAILWAVILAITFAPLDQWWLSVLHQRRTPAALGTVVSVVLMVILPLALVTAALVQEGAGLYQRIQSGDIDIARYFRQLMESLPAWVISVLDRLGLTDLAALQERLSAELTRAAQFVAAEVLAVGQNTLAFAVSLILMLYLLFFLVRDGAELNRRIRDALPLAPALQDELADRFATVVRATVKGSVVVAIVQGVLGGVALWLLGIHAPVLWGALMAVLSLLPAVGTGLVWGPIAIYLFATGAVWRAIGLALYGAVVIGSVDNVLRPVLVGKETRMPDYLVLFSTLGGLAVFGVNGVVIGPMIAAMFVAVWDIRAGATDPRPVA